jgi:hypothetical protein
MAGPHPPTTGAVFLQIVVSALFLTKFRKLSGAFVDSTLEGAPQNRFSTSNQVADDNRLCRQLANERKWEGALGGVQTFHGFE